MSKSGSLAGPPAGSSSCRTMSPEAEHVKDIGKQAFLEAIDTAACLAILTAGNASDVIAEIERRRAERAAIIVRKALFQRVLMNVARALAATIRKGDAHTAVAFKLLEDQMVFEEVAQQGSRKDLDMRAG